MQEEVDKEHSSESSDVYSSDDDQKWTKELKSEYRSAKKRRIANEHNNSETFCDVDKDWSNVPSNLKKQPKFYEIKEGEEHTNTKLNFNQNLR